MNLGMLIEPARRIAAMARTCPACGDAPDISADAYSSHPNEVFTASCHGSTDVFVLIPDMMRNPDVALTTFSRWIGDLFKDDAFPDMLELLAYNRGRLPERLK